MTHDFHTDVLTRLKNLDLVVPQSLPAPAGQYVAYRLHRGLGFLAAQVPGYGPGAPIGRLGAELTLEEGQTAARLAALNALGRINEALGTFSRLEGLLHVAGHVASVDTFLEQPKVLDGASRLFNEVLLERGLHTRTAYASTRLPHNISIELEITFAYTP